MAFDQSQAKNIVQSSTFWGAVISLFGLLAPALWTKLFGTASQATVVQDIITGVGFIMTVYGRLTATQVTTLTAPLIKPTTKP